jgi:hypothetical protein
VQQRVAALQPGLVDGGDLLAEPSAHQQLEAGSIVAQADPPAVDRDGTE